MSLPGHTLRILALEPYYGGSHRAVLDGLVGAIDAEWTLLTLPARKWKWRMRGSGVTMAAEARHLATERSRAATTHAAAAAAADTTTTDLGSRAPWDLIFASTFVNLAEFRGLAGAAIAPVPAIVYFHENQLVYPNRHTAEWDYQFPLTNITSALSAERCLFNTRWNLEQFIAEIPGFLARFPDYRPQHVAEAVAKKSHVVPPPFDPAEFDQAPTVRGDRCRIIWPHRWEHDKDPEGFIAALGELAAEGLDFEAVIAGQAFKETETLIRSAAGELGDRLVFCEQPADRGAYARLLASADIAVSTARNEFFGLAMIEASYAGCMPLVPDRLAYPGLYPPAMRYSGADGLVARLREHILSRPMPGQARSIAEDFTLGRLAPRFESVFEEVAGAVRHS
ncbi:MAG: DUF3524 domain-containing protein [Coriobacteriia bacterium]|nr:DUF3524 domain-containing protein [Coriobacteriia bacterium]